MSSITVTSQDIVHAVCGLMLDIAKQWMTNDIVHTCGYEERGTP